MAFLYFYEIANFIVLYPVLRCHKVNTALKKRLEPVQQDSNRFFTTLFSISQLVQ